jgi:hypothetical protein
MVSSGMRVQANPRLFDLHGLDFGTYRHVASEWQNWENVVQQCQRVACDIFSAMAKTSEPDSTCSCSPGF